MRYLDARIGLGIRPGNERVAALMDAMGDPQHDLRAVHVSGTNGKFSVAAIASMIMSELGLSVGTYISPHLESVTERIAVGCSPVSDHEFAKVLNYLVPFVELVESKRPDKLTWFELLTCMAIETFFDRGVHACVLETGLGGEYDATNVVDAEVAVIASISNDHVAEFGGDLLRAAWEKAGIIKQGTAVITGVQDPDLLRVVQERAAERGARSVSRLGREIEVLERLPAVGGQSFTVRGLEAEYSDLYLPAFGEHQASNAALAIAAVESFGGGALDRDGVAAALAAVRLPARIEVVSRRPLVVVDGGHNPAAATHVVNTLRAELDHERIVVVLGMMADKLIDEVAAIMASAATVFHLCRPNSDRAATTQMLSEALRDAEVEESAITEHDSVGGAIQAALNDAGEQDLVLIFGSLYTAAEARSWLRETGVLPQS